MMFALLSAIFGRAAHRRRAVMASAWRTLLVCAGAALLLSPLAQSARADDKPKSHDVAKFLLDGWRSEREKLTRGKVRIEGFEQTRESRYGVSVTMTFDHAAASRKYDIV